MRIVVTAGPTRERIDRVRYLSNFSSGKMGFEVASAAVRRGHSVTVIAGPTHLEAPGGVQLIEVESARDMLSAIRAPFRDCEALVMTAAVADYRPARRLVGKLRKSDGPLELTLVRNPDILETLAPMKGHRIIVGFALESTPTDARARAKMTRKNMDFVVMNDPTSFSSTHIRARVLGKDGSRLDLGRKTKHQVAVKIVRLLELARAHGR